MNPQAWTLQASSRWSFRFCKARMSPVALFRNVVSTKLTSPHFRLLPLETAVEHFLLAFVDTIGENGNRREGDAARLQPSSSIINLEPIHLIGTDEFLRSAAHYRTDVAGL